MLITSSHLWVLFSISDRHFFLLHLAHKVARKKLFSVCQSASCVALLIRKPSCFVTSTSDLSLTGFLLPAMHDWRGSVQRLATRDNLLSISWHADKRDLGLIFFVIRVCRKL
jgi:hypothetical protein